MNRSRIFKNGCKAFCPPLLWTAMRSVFGIHDETTPTTEPPEFEFLSHDWPAQQAASLRGWNQKSVVNAYLSRWEAFRKALQGNGPLAVSPEGMDPATGSPSEQNLVLAYGYILALTALKAQPLHILDWGGGLGHYFLLAQALLPMGDLHYSCKDVALLAEAGRQLLPKCRFYSDDSCLKETYDLVMASGSLYYAEDWRTLLQQLAQVSRHYVYITRMPMIHNSPSYAFVQRPYKYGYDTEYVGWALKEREFLEAAEENGLLLQRTFIFSSQIEIAQATECPQLRGYLFRVDCSRSFNA